MKKMLTLCLVLATALVGQAQVPVVQSTTIPAVSAPAAAKNMKKAQYANQVTVDNIIYGIDTEAAKAVVLGADDDIFDLVIADQVTFNDVAYPVTEVNARAFMRNGTIETIQFPASMKYIGSWAFYEASALQSVTLPDGIEKTDTCCFRHCVSLESVDMGQGIKEVGYGTFSENPGLTSVVFPASVQIIGGYCVEKCPNLATITIQSPSLEYVGYSAFNETAISEIIFPETVTNMQMSVCRMCNNLKHVVLPTNLTAVPGQMFTLCAGLEEITLPESITTLSSEAFYGNEALRSINLDNITRYEHACLYETHALTGNIVFNENTTLIGDFAFRGSAISGIKTGANVETIDNYAFWACYNLKNIDLGEGLQAIGMGAFGDTRFSTIAFPSTVIDVEGYAVLQNPNLIALGCKAVDVPEMVNKLDLVSDYNATTLYVPEASIEGYKAAEIWQKFANVKPIDEMPMLAEYTQDGIIYELNLTQGTAILVDGKAATGNIVVPNTITRDRDVVCTVIGIGNGAFDENTNLTSITLNEDLETIGDDAFQYSSIPALHLPAKVKSVGHDFHYKATSLAEITVDENNPYLCAENSLLMSKDKKIVWGFPVANPATELVLPEEVEIVKNDAVNRCKNLLKIVINDGCKTIEDYAFDNCTACIELIIGKGVETIGYRSFRSLSSMTSVTMPDELIEIGEYAFHNCAALPELKLPNKLERINHWAFNNCVSLKTVELPASLVYMGAGSFNGNSAMETMISYADVPFEAAEIFTYEPQYTITTLKVPAGSAELYRNAPIWMKFTNIEEMPWSAVDAVKTTNEAHVVGIYTLDGKRLSEMQSGVNIVRMSDGTARKVIK